MASAGTQRGTVRKCDVSTGVVAGGLKMTESILKSTRLAAGEAILELARERDDIVAVSADTNKSMYTDLLAKEYPDRMIDVGIAEQNMMMVAAGLASTGKTAFVASYSVFTSMRCCEQLRTFVAYPNLNVKIIGGIGGFSAGIEGVTHVATEDLGIVRCIPNVTVISPCDYQSTKLAVKAAAEIDGPVYIRVGRDSTPVITDESYDFKVGEPVLHKKGTDVTIIATGLVLEEALRSCDELEAVGFSANVIEVHTLKPLKNSKLIEDCIKQTKNVVTVEEHNVVGGLFSVIAEMAFKSDIGMVKSKALGLNDEFAKSGTPYQLRKKYGVDSKNITKAAMSLI